MTLSTAELQLWVAEQKSPWPEEVGDLLFLLDWVGLNLKWEPNDLRPESEKLQWSFWAHQLRWFDKLMGLFSGFTRSERLMVPIVYPPVEPEQMNASVARYREIINKRGFWDGFETIPALSSELKLKWHRTKVLMAYPDWRVLFKQLKWLNWVELPKGRFIKYAPNKDPFNQCTIHLSKTVRVLDSPVTSALWSWVMKDEFMPEYAQEPKVNVSWWEACLFCNRLSEKFGYEPVYTVRKPDWFSRVLDPDVPAIEYFSWKYSGSGFRIPTECEWLYMAGSGKHLTVLPASQRHEGMSAISTWPQNAWTFKGCGGPILEWVWDTHEPSFWLAGHSTLRNPRGSDYFKKRKKLMGSTWKTERPIDNEDLDHRSEDIGFRVVLDMER